MKKSFVFLFFISLVCAFCFAATAKGDYSLDEVDNTLCSGLIYYMKSSGLLEEFSGYGIYMNDDVWNLSFSDSYNKYPVLVYFNEDTVVMGRICDFDFSSIDEEAVLNAINTTASTYAEWTTFAFAEKKVFASTIIMTEGLTLPMLASELRWFRDMSALGFTSIGGIVGVE